MPLPWSATGMTTSQSLARPLTVMVPPSGIASQAFISKFTKRYMSSPEGPTIAGRSENWHSISYLFLSSFWDCRHPINSTASSTIARKSIGVNWPMPSAPLTNLFNCSARCAACLSCRSRESRSEGRTWLFSSDNQPEKNPLERISVSWANPAPRVPTKARRLCFESSRPYLDEWSEAGVDAD
jgi:hypothetical protein